jgi:hypothetical protein
MCYRMYYRLVEHIGVLVRGIEGSIRLQVLYTYMTTRIIKGVRDIRKLPRQQCTHIAYVDTIIDGI